MVFDKVQEYIRNKNLSGNSAFERLCGLGNGTVSGWVNGNPRIETLERLEKATGLSITYWIGKDNDLKG